jgi:microcystin-dependent protein
MLKKTKRAFITLASAAVIAATIGWSTPASASEPFIAEIKMFGGNFAPRGYALCNGQLLPVSQNSALFAILGTTYGGDGRTTFGLPDLRGRFAMHAGNGPGLAPRSLGARGGEENVTLSAGQIPSHTHNAVATTATTVTIKGTDAAGNEQTPGGNTWATKNRADDYSTGIPGDIMNAANATATSNTNVTVSSTGGGISHNNMPPFTVVNYIIALQGVFPSRN